MNKYIVYYFNTKHEACSMTIRAYSRSLAALKAGSKLSDGQEVTAIHRDIF